MDLKMEVYTPALELIGILEVQNSVIWESNAFSAGTFSVQSILTEESRSLLVEENIIWIEGDTAGIIEHVHQEVGEDGPYINVQGRDLTSVLDRRILWGQYDLSGTVLEIMRYLVNDCAISPTRGPAEERKIPNLVMTDEFTTGGPTISIQRTGRNLLDTLEELGQTYGISFGVRFDPAVPRMEFWARPGVNRSVNQNTNEPVFYSTELDDVLSSEYDYNSKNYRNIALVAGEGEGTDRTYITVDYGGQAPAARPVGFVVSGDSAAMRTADGKAFNAVAISANGDVYQSAYTGPQIDEAIGKALSGGGGGTAGVTMEEVNAAIYAAITGAMQEAY